MAALAAFAALAAMTMTMTMAMAITMTVAVTAMTAFAGRKARCRYDDDRCEQHSRYAHHVVPPRRVPVASQAPRSRLHATGRR